MLIAQKTKLLLLSIFTLLLFSFAGCGTTNQVSVNELDSKAQMAIASEMSYQDSRIDAETSILNKRITIAFNNAPVYVAVKRVADKAGLKFDTTFTPSSEYRVTMSFSGTVLEFLDLVYKQSGVDYKLRNGILSVFNPEFIDREYRAAGCGSNTQKIAISLKGVPPSKVFDYFTEKRKFNVEYDTRFYNVSGNSPEQAMLNNVNFFWDGCDEKEAIYRFAKANDLDVEFKGAKSFIVRDYKTIKLDVPTYFKLDFTSSDGSVGGSSGGGSGGAKLSETDDSKKDIQDLLETYLSPNGKAFLANRGYLVVTDTPSKISEIRKILQKEIASQQSIDLSISIIRVDISDDFKNGVDWSLAFKNLGEKLNIRNLAAGLNYANTVEGGLSISGLSYNKQQVIDILSRYGNAKIVRDYTVSTRSGILSTFKAVQRIPYVTTSVINNGQTSQTTAEAKEVEAGLILNVKPTLSQNNEMVNFAIDATMSEYLGDKIFDVNGGKYVLPQIVSNVVQLPANVSMNKTVILTGLKLRSVERGKEGIPELSRLDMVGGLFGSNTEAGKVSEFLIVLSPKSARRY